MFNKQVTFFLLLFGTFLTLFGVLFWAFLYMAFPVVLERQFVLFGGYPIIEIAFTAIAWYLNFKKDYTRAVFILCVPIVITIVLIVYFALIAGM